MQKSKDVAIIQRRMRVVVVKMISISPLMGWRTDKS
jgi:hypothetical protein